MANKKPQESCALCGLPVEIKGFTLIADNREEKFCCAGCLSIYQLFNDHNDTITIIDTPPDNEDKDQ